MEQSAKPQSAVSQSGNPVEGLYAFARAHLLVINAVVLASSTLVGFLDFLAPRLSLVPTIIYSATGMLVVLMLVSAFAPALVARLVSRIGVAMSISAGAPLWRRPGWQVSVAIMVGVTILGFMSVAKASQGGLIASSAPSLRALQESVLGLRAELGNVNQGVTLANAKLDSLVVGSQDPRHQLVARGYPVNESGLVEAIRQGDQDAVGLFTKIAFPMQSGGPLTVLLFGHQPWNSAIADAVSRLPVINPVQVCSAGFFFSSPTPAPLEARIAVFKQACDPRTVIERFEWRMGREAGDAPLTAEARTQREYRARTLALLKE